MRQENRATNTDRRPGKSGKTVVLGVDSYDLLLLERWAKEGHLPFFAELMETSPLVRLSALSRVLQGAVWPSMLIGRHPGHHGLIHLTQIKNGTYDFENTHSDHYKDEEKFYTRLGANGVRSAIVDIPTDYPQSGFKGMQVVDWGTEFRFWDFSTQPETWKQEIKRRFGLHPFIGWMSPDTPEGHLRMRKKLEKCIRLKADLARKILKREDLDLVFLVFGESHRAGHFYWMYMDPGHPDHIDAKPELRDALLTIYRQLDRELAELSEMLGPEDDLLVFSDHGMQANYRGDHFVEPILQKLGLLTLNSGIATRGSQKVKRNVWTNSYFKIRQRAKAWVRKTIPGTLPFFRKIAGPAPRVDWQNTQAFQLPTDRNSYLRINLQGREPNGIVSPGAEYDALLDRIEREFRALINPATGQSAVEEVFHVHRMYPGPKVGDLPDIAVLWRSDGPIDAVESPAVGRIEHRFREQRSGNHRPEGFLFARGPSFLKGPGTYHGDVLQMAPTLLALHGLDYPENYAMGPLTEIFAPETGDFSQCDLVPEK